MLLIRQALDSDTSALAGLRAAWTAEDSGSFLEAGGADGQVFEETYRAWAERNPRTVFVADQDGELIGMLNLAVFERMPRPGREPSRWVYLGNAYVRPGHRSRGVGGRLVEAAVGFAQGIRAVRMVLSPSPDSERFYERAGFIPADELWVRRLS
jgi:GNAT superfamily N-acetyltransferase